MARIIDILTARNNMAEVTLKNISRRMINLNLDHPNAPRTRYTYYQRSLDRRTGKAGIKRMHLSMPGSLIILAGRSKGGLPGWVAEMPTVKRLVAQRMLAVTVAE